MKNMKKKKLILIIVIGILLMPSTINAASCKKITSKQTCKSTNGCVWSNKTSKCTKKTTSSSTKKPTSSSTKKPASSSTKPTTSSSTSVDFCASTASIWQVVGYVFFIVKIVIPLLLLIFGVKDLAQTVISGKDDGIKSAAKSLAIRGISAILIFFVPTIVSLIMGLVVDFTNSGAEADYNICEKCILDPSKCDTSKDVGKQ